MNRQYKNITLIVIILLYYYGCAIPLKSGLKDASKIKSFNIVDQLLRDNKKVSIVVIGGQVYSRGKPNIAWKERLQTSVENVWLHYTGGVTNFSIVNRSYISSIINEITLSNSGLISESTRIKIGNLTGATHILIVDAYYTRAPFIVEENIYWKLIEIQTGNILSIDHFQSSEIPAF